MSELKGYSYIRVSTKKALRTKLASELKEKVDMVKLEEQLDHIKKKGGIMYGIKKDGDIKGLVAIEVKKYNVSDFDLEEGLVKLTFIDKMIIKLIDVCEKVDRKCARDKEKYLRKLDTVNAYEMMDIYLTSELENRDKLIMFDIIDDLKRQIGYGDTNARAVIWGEDVIADNNIGVTLDSAQAIGLVFWMLVGAMFGIVIAILGGNVIFTANGLCIGLLFGIAYVKRYFKAGKKVVKEENLCH